MCHTTWQTPVWPHMHPLYCTPYTFWYSKEVIETHFQSFLISLSRGKLHLSPIFHPLHLYDISGKTSPCPSPPIAHPMFVSTCRAKIQWPTSSSGRLVFLLISYPTKSLQGLWTSSQNQQEAVLKATAVGSPLPAMSLVLPYPPCLPQVMQAAGGVWGQGVWVWGEGAGVWGRGRGLRGRGQGTFHPPCHILHYHMVLRPEGTSHNGIMSHPAQPPSGHRRTQRGNFCQFLPSKSPRKKLSSALQHLKQDIPSPMLHLPPPHDAPGTSHSLQLPCALLLLCHIERPSCWAEHRLMTCDPVVKSAATHPSI